MESTQETHDVVSGLLDRMVQEVEEKVNAEAYYNEFMTDEEFTQAQITKASGNVAQEVVDKSKKQFQDRAVDCCLMETELMTSHRQLQQQSAYCTNMGATLATLLWRLSKQPDAIDTIINSGQLDACVTLTAGALGTFLQACGAGCEPSEEEAGFIQALCGVITNVAAAAQGRHELARAPALTSLLHSYMCCLANVPNEVCARLKTLLLMTMYNLSINQDGFAALCKVPDILGVIFWIIDDSQREELVGAAVRLAHSLSWDGHLTDLYIRSKVRSYGLRVWARRGDCSKALQQSVSELLRVIHVTENES